MREGDDDALVGAHERGELLLGLGEPACGDRGPLRLERVRLRRAGTGRAARRPRAERASASPPPRRARPPPARRRGPGRGRVRHEVVRDSTSLVLVAQRRLDEVDAALGRRVDRRASTGCSARCVNGENARICLDLVAEELDPQRLAAGRREDVDEPAADGELAALLDALDALVAGERELLGEPVDPGLLAGGELDAAPAAASGGGIRSASAAADAQTSPPAASTSSARARSPTRCGGGSSPDSHATPRLGKQRDLLVAEVPAAASAASRASASSGSSDDERPLEPQVERRQEERQRRLGDARATRRRSSSANAPRPLAVGELPGEWIQRRPVHDDRRNRAVPLRSSVLAATLHTVKRAAALAAVARRPVRRCAVRLRRAAVRAVRRQRAASAGRSASRSTTRTLRPASSACTSRCSPQSARPAA